MKNISAAKQDFNENEVSNCLAKIDYIEEKFNNTLQNYHELKTECNNDKSL